MEKITIWLSIKATLRLSKKLDLSQGDLGKVYKLGIPDDFLTTGIKPWATIGPYLYLDISREGNYSKCMQTSKQF